jgi:Ca2+-binding RTX toxin-like protein
MMQSIFGRQLGIVGADRVGRDRKARSRRLQPSVDGLESRNLMSVVVGSVTLSGSAVMVAPAPTGSSTAIVSLQKVSSVTEVDVNLNGTDHYFALGSVSMVYFNGTGVAGNQTFTNHTALLTVAYGGSGTNTFTGGSGMDEFIGGSGTNDFYAGSGYDILAGGTGTNVYNESATGSGIILEVGGSNTINDPTGATGSYQTY